MLKTKVINRGTLLMRFQEAEKQMDVIGDNLEQRKLQLGTGGRDAALQTWQFSP